VPTPPVPTGHSAVQNDDDSFIELCDEGTPRNRWYYDNGTDSWIPIKPANTLIKENDYYIEMDEDGIPMGIWAFDEAAEEWIWISNDDIVPLDQFNVYSGLPKTGAMPAREQWPILELSIIGVLMIIQGCLLVFRKRKHET
jgi:hypothetical protein